MKLPTFENPLQLFTPAFAGSDSSSSGFGGRNMMFASSGSGSGGGGYDDDDYGYDDDYGFEDSGAPEDEQSQRPQSNRTRRSAGRAAANGGRSRTGSVQPTERYWTDYLRIALPVIGIILMLGLLWVWASSLLGDDADVDDTPEDTIGLVTTETPDPNAVNTEPDSVSTPDQSETETNSGEIPIPGQTTPEPTTPASTGEEAPVDGGDNQAGEEESTEPEEPEEETSGEITGTSRVRITEDNVNVRPSAGLSDEASRVANSGEEADIAAGPEEADGYVWWQVVFDDGEGGWVVEDFLEVVP